MKKILLKILIIFLLVFIGVSVLYGGFSIVKNWSKGVVDNRATAQAIERLEAEYQEKTKQYEETFKQNETLKNNITRLQSELATLELNYTKLLAEKNYISELYKQNSEEIRELNTQIDVMELENQSLTQMKDYLTSQNEDLTNTVYELNQTIEEQNIRISQLLERIESLENELLERVETMTFSASTNDKNNLIAEIVVTNAVYNSCYIELSDLNLEINTDKFYAINYIQNGTQYNFKTFTATYIEAEQCTVINAETQENVTLRIYAYDYSNIVKLRFTGLNTNDTFTLNIQDADTTEIIYWQDNDIKKYILVENNTIEFKVNYKTACELGTEFSETPTEETLPTLFQPIVKSYINGIEFNCDDMNYSSWLTFDNNKRKYVYSGCNITATSKQENEFVINYTNLVINKINNTYAKDEDGNYLKDEAGNYIPIQKGYFEINSNTLSDNQTLSIKGNNTPLTINFVWEFEKI